MGNKTTRTLAFSFIYYFPSFPFLFAGDSSSRSFILAFVVIEIFVILSSHINIPLHRRCICAPVLFRRFPPSKASGEKTCPPSSSLASQSFFSNLPYIFIVSSCDSFQLEVKIQNASRYFYPIRKNVIRGCTSENVRWELQILHITSVHTKTCTEKRILLDKIDNLLDTFD